MSSHSEDSWRVHEEKPKVWVVCHDLFCNKQHYAYHPFHGVNEPWP